MRYCTRMLDWWTQDHTARTLNGIVDISKVVLGAALGYGAGWFKESREKRAKLQYLVGQVCAVPMFDEMPYRELTQLRDFFIANPKLIHHPKNQAAWQQLQNPALYVIANGRGKPGNWTDQNHRNLITAIMVVEWP